MRMSDWSADVCSSDLDARTGGTEGALEARARRHRGPDRRGAGATLCRGRVPARVQGAHGATGAEPPRRAENTDRGPRLDEPGNQGEGTGEVGGVRIQDRLSGQVARLERLANQPDRKSTRLNSRHY